MYTQCVYIHPVSGVFANFPLKVKKVTGVVRKTVYTKFVFNVNFTALSPCIPLKQKIGYWYCKRPGV